MTALALPDKSIAEGVDVMHGIFLNWGRGLEDP
jgi:hypothetical protein